MQVGTFGQGILSQEGFNANIIVFVEKRELKEDVNLI
jgi:hypothetical protein